MINGVLESAGRVLETVERLFFVSYRLEDIFPSLSDLFGTFRAD